MDVPAELAADLAELTAALDLPGTDLEASLEAFGARVTAAVASFIGLTLTLFADDLPFVLTVRRRADGADASASLLLPMSAIRAVEDEGRLVLYASTPGAFVDLAADLGVALGREPDMFVLDRHLPLPDAHQDTGLRDIATVNQALGVLMARGRSTGQARAELHELARAAGTGVVAVAAQVIGSLAGRPPPGPD